MRNYIVLNGQNSNEITGLLIQSLPPISQPKIRTNIEEIDGRDGDIITKLGYSAYNKEISIGLYGNYDVDDIIKYFTDNQSGKVTFSDEPDKYYNYEILEQIDFERLIRYRTATVKLHCQPFKYSTTEEKIQINATEVSGSGSNITLENTEDGTIFTSLQINGDTSQDGTPTPSSPVPINVVSGDNTINIVGKNSFKPSNTKSNGITTTYDKFGTGTINGTASNNWADISDYFYNVLPVGKYTISLDNIKSFNVGLKGKYSDGTFFDFAIYSGQTSKIINLSKETKFYYLYITGISGETIYNTTIKFQLEAGEAATPYEPYVSQTYSVDLGLIELCKIGDYQDYIYKENGNWYLYKAIGKAVLDGSENWQYSAQTNSVFYVQNLITDFARSNNIPLSNYYVGKTNVRNTSGASNNENNTISFNNYSSTNYLYVVNNTYTSANDFKTWLSTHNTIVYYQLATSTTTQITDTTLLSQLEALASATTYLGQTNIITNGDDLSPLLDVTTYAVDDPNFTITNNGNIYSKPIITIYGVGTIGLYLNGIQVLSLDMGETTSQITIDVAKLEAYNQETGALMNRSVTGDYNNLSLNVGENTITESGTLQGLEVENYSRWL